MIERGELESAKRELQDQIMAVQYQQMWANTRIRQDIMKATASVSVTSGAVLLMWGGVDFRWWFLLAPAIVMPFLMARDNESILKQDMPKQ